MEKIYEIYIWDYHWETAIDEIWLCILMHEAESIAKRLYKLLWQKIKVWYVEVETTCQEIARMQVAKYQSAEERWVREDLELNK